MKVRVLLITGIFIVSILPAFSQCGAISMIGDFSGWADDLFMTPDQENPLLHKGFLYVDENDDPTLDGIVEMKFREDSAWYVNWGNSDFPHGFGFQNGPNVPMPYGNYFVTFNCSTGEYNFTQTNGPISLIGEFNGYSGDLYMNRSVDDIQKFSIEHEFTSSDDTNLDGFIDVKFRESGEWINNWGGEDFPSGYGIMNGQLIPVPYGKYLITFDYENLFYNFELQTGIDETLTWNEQNSGPFNAFNHPNPFSFATAIVYELDQPGNVNLKIFNQTGQLIETLVDEWQPKGKHEKRWQAEGLPVGIYFFRINAGNQVFSGKMILN